jgi:divalent metal cation (Fe/Co/Zn/Cd) transporter
VHQVLAIYIGPNQVWIVARVSVNPSPRVEQISSIVRELDAGLRQASEAIFRVDIVIASYP